MEAASYSIPFLGWSPGKARGDELQRLLFRALEAGCRHIASDYNNRDEEDLGMALEKVFESRKLRREDLFISAKLPFIGNDPRRVEHFARKSLKNLRLDYLDLYSISSPIGLRYIDDDTTLPLDTNGIRVLYDFQTDIIALWKAMESVVEFSLTKSIGLCHFNASQIKKIFRYGRTHPAALQVECHPYFQQAEMFSMCSEFGIEMVALYPFGFEGEEENYCSHNALPDYSRPLKNPVIKKMSSRRNCCGEAIIQQFHTIRKTPIIVAEPANFWSPKQPKINLSAAEINSLRALDRGKNGRMYCFDEAFKGSVDHSQYPFHGHGGAPEILTADIVYPDRYKFS